MIPFVYYLLLLLLAIDCCSISHSLHDNDDDTVVFLSHNFIVWRSARENVGPSRESVNENEINIHFHSTIEYERIFICERQQYKK
jgi:hypothetical protein